MRSVLLSLFLRLVMGRLHGLKWRMRYGNPNTRMREMRFFLSFEIYSLFCILNAYTLRHWLRPKSLGPAGKYLRFVRNAPRFVRFLDRKFSFGEVSHCDYLPYTAEVETDLRSRGETFMIVELSYRERTKCDRRWEESCSLFLSPPDWHWEHGPMVDVRSLADRLSG